MHCVYQYTQPIITESSVISSICREDRVIIFFGFRCATERPGACAHLGVRVCSGRGDGERPGLHAHLDQPGPTPPGWFEAALGCRRRGGDRFLRPLQPTQPHSGADASKGYARGSTEVYSPGSPHHERIFCCSLNVVQ